MADEEISLKPGTYRLARDVENPTPDRRFKDDWRFFSTWKAGWEFLVTVRYPDLDDVEGLTPDQRERLRELRKTVNIARVGYRWTHRSVGAGNEAQFRALALNLEPCSESHEALFTRLGVDGTSYFVRWLVETERLTPAQFEALWEQYQNDEETPPKRPTFRISDIDAEIDKKLIEQLSDLDLNRSGAV